jgi:hypothetical protein
MLIGWGKTGVISCSDTPHTLKYGGFFCTMQSASLIAEPSIIWFYPLDL